MTRFDPWRIEIAAPWQALRGEIHRLVAHYRGPEVLGSRPDDQADAATWAPALDLYETADEVGLLVDLPGVDPSAIELSVTGRALFLRGVKPEDPERRGAGRTLERPSGPFSRKV